MLKGSVWNPIHLWDEAKEMMVTTYGEYVFFFHFAVVPYTFSGVVQKRTEHKFYTWKCIGIWKKVDLNFWISSCVDIYNYNILLMLNTLLYCSQCRLYWRDTSIVIDITSTTPLSLAKPCMLLLLSSISFFPPPHPRLLLKQQCGGGSCGAVSPFVPSLADALLCLCEKTLEQGGAELQHTWSYWEPANPSMGLGNGRDCARVRGPKT